MAIKKCTDCTPKALKNTFLAYHNLSFFTAAYRHRILNQRRTHATYPGQKKSLPYRPECFRAFVKSEKKYRRGAGKKLTKDPMTQTQISPKNITKTPEEQILVIKREHLFPAGEKKQGFFPENLDSYLELINKKKEFFPRSAMEKDPQYKQIIPYLIFTHTPPGTPTDFSGAYDTKNSCAGKQKFFLMQRTAVASEQRLRNKYSLGIGGHIRQEDLQENSIFAWATREFHEEVHYNGQLTVEPLGILNDDSNEVGTVHVGLVLLIHGNSDEICIKSELKQGALLSLFECKQYAPDMENWSQLVFEYLTKR